MANAISSGHETLVNHPWVVGFLAILNLGAGRRCLPWARSRFSWHTGHSDRNDISPVQELNKGEEHLLRGGNLNSWDLTVHVGKIQVLC